MFNRTTLKNYQVLGANLHSIMGGFGSFTLIASKFLLDEGIGTSDESGMVRFDLNKWYPLDGFLRVFDRIHAEFGHFTLRQVGLHVIRSAKLPLHIGDIFALFDGIDLTYHLNHGRGDKPLLDVVTMQMAEGIGHYRIKEKTANRITIEAETPYPCPFDEGLVTGAAQRFKPIATITHEKNGCRLQGGVSCTYTASWK